MSTGVDRSRRAARPSRSSAAETRAKIFQTARVAFSQAGFDQLGVREIAAAAGVDPAVVIRTFGSKEALFAAVAESAFVLESPFEGPVESLGLRVAQHLTSTKTASVEDDFDEFAFLMRSAASPTAAPILSAALHASFIGPLGKYLGGADAQLRATLLTSAVLGFATLRVALGSPVIEGAARTKLTRRLGEVLQACVAVG